MVITNEFFPTFFPDTQRLSMWFLRCKALYVVINFLVLWNFSLSFSLVHFKNSLEYLTRATLKVFIPLMRFLPQKFSGSFWNSLLFYFHFCLFHGVIFEYIQVFLIFLFSKSSDVFLIWQFYSFCCFSIPTFHCPHFIFLYPKFHSYIWAIYSYCLYWLFSFILILDKYFCNLVMAIYFRLVLTPRIRGVLVD